MDQGDVPLQGDFSAEHTIFGVDGVDPVRREKLVDLQWHMHKVSDGQRRRVQICMGLLHPYKKNYYRGIVISREHSCKSFLLISDAA
ncbi:ABC transporter I family member 21-like isoform X1 [Phragmites australis]|uniref:ABC transporter I family member 21-like isoform X1 n=1 Tax=Phragmites australis TaxID=29695 RepID=UPI002D76F83D|nr:ABC transporter I family member 21-like isoform X1 [Phragmites australis]